MINFKKFIFLILLFILFILYYNHHHANIYIEESKMYDHMINSIEENYISSAKYFAKKIIKKNHNTVYHKLAVIFLYSGNNMKKIKKELLFYGVIKNEKKYNNT